MATEQEFIATGRRKNAVARIRMTAGTGKIEINGRPLEEYFKTLPLQNTVLKPFEVAKLVNTFDVQVNAHGGGVNGQAGAVRLAVSRALIEQNPELRARAEGRGPADPRPADERAQEERPARRPQALPVLQALSASLSKALRLSLLSPRCAPHVRSAGFFFPGSAAAGRRKALRLSTKDTKDMRRRSRNQRPGGSAAGGVETSSRKNKKSTDSGTKSEQARQPGEVRRLHRDRDEQSFLTRENR